MTTYKKSKFPPVACEGLQVNFCRQVDCPNFGISRQADKQSPVPINRDGEAVGYTFRGDKKNITLRCNHCGRSFKIKSNASIIREKSRIESYYKHVDYISCPNFECENHFREISFHPDSYQKFGYTNKNTPRLRCKICSKTFTNAKRDLNHAKSHLNFRILKLLLNHMPINRICEIENVSPKLYTIKLIF